MSELRRPAEPDTEAAAPFCFALVVSRTNADITAALLDGAREALRRHGAFEEAVEVYEVPGAFELPMTAAELAASGTFDAVVCLGALIRGETPHFDYLASAVAHGIQDVGILSGTPAICGVLTCEDRAQAAARAGGDKGNKGEEAALAAIEMAHLFATIGPDEGDEGDEGQGG